MKTKKEKVLSLQKLTITAIGMHSMQKIKGGNCDPTEPDTGTHWSHCTCPDVF